MERTGDNSYYKIIKIEHFPKKEGFYKPFVIARSDPKSSNLLFLFFILTLLITVIKYQCKKKYRKLFLGDNL